jgi:hypothetical protein
MKTSFLILTLLFSFSLWAQNQTIYCESGEGKDQLQLKVVFESEDMSKNASFIIKGEKLFADKKDKQDSCRAFAMRSHSQFNSYVIHNVGCDIWNCSLFTPDTIHGEALEHFRGKLQCFPSDSDENIWKKFDLHCSSTL